MDDYLSKPFSIHQLEEVLRRWLPATPPGDDLHVDSRVLEDLLNQTGGGPDLLRSLIGAYLRDAPARLAAIHDGMARGDAAAVARAAHAFKSGNANLGASGLAEMCRRLEAHCRAGATAGAEPLVEQIHEECAHVAADLSRRARETTP
jgi:HPt (histidine-containing phosphotransfer) domain-containing protein